MPTPTDRRKVKPTLLYVCGECREANPDEWGYLPLENGKYCPAEGHERGGTMRKRRVWLCPYCDEEGNGYLSRQAFLEHVCAKEDW